MIVKNLKLTMILLRAPTIITVICPVAQSLTATGQILKRFPIILCLLEDQRVAIIRSSVEPDLEKHTHRQREGESINSLWWSYIKLAWMRGSKEGQNTEKGDAQVRSWGFVVWFHAQTGSTSSYHHIICFAFCTIFLLDSVLDFVSCILLQLQLHYKGLNVPCLFPIYS